MSTQLRQSFCYITAYTWSLLSYLNALLDYAPLSTFVMAPAFIVLLFMPCGVSRYM